MIYIVVCEYGQYSDYSHTNLFASTSKEVAEAKLKYYEEVDKIKQQAHKEYTPWLSVRSAKYREEILLLREKAITFSKYFKSKTYNKGYSEKTYNTECNELAVEYTKNLTEKQYELALKYNISYEDFGSYYNDEASYSIEEVESD